MGGQALAPTARLWLDVSSFQDSWPVRSFWHNFVPLWRETHLWRFWSTCGFQGLLAEFVIHCGPGISILEKLSWVILSCSPIWVPLLESPLHSRREPFKVTRPGSGEFGYGRETGIPWAPGPGLELCRGKTCCL